MTDKPLASLPWKVEARAILKSALTGAGGSRGRSLSERIHARFAALGGVELELPPCDAGRAISMADAMIAVIAGAHPAGLVIRNTRDFEGCELRLIDPWQDPAG